jgi:hypothetical protein
MTLKWTRGPTIQYAIPHRQIAHTALDLPGCTAACHYHGTFTIAQCGHVVSEVAYRTDLLTSSKRCECREDTRQPPDQANSRIIVCCLTKIEHSAAVTAHVHEHICSYAAMAAWRESAGACTILHTALETCRCTSFWCSVQPCMYLCCVTHLCGVT